jgi:hypothetical protein
VIGVDPSLDLDRERLAGVLLDKRSSFSTRPSTVVSNWKSSAHT